MQARKFRERIYFEFYDKITAKISEKKVQCFSSFFMHTTFKNCLKLPKNGLNPFN